jgi:predicted RNase H-like nuclease
MRSTQQSAPPIEGWTPELGPDHSNYIADVRVAGADVWKGKWIAVSLSDGRFEGSHVASSIETLVEQLGQVDRIGVDIPIGLPPAGESRRCDRLAAAYVGPRKASVFQIPCEELLGAETLQTANALARANSWPGISAQSYALKKRIFEVAGVAVGDDRIYEVHPEVSFAEANGGVPMRSPKSSWDGLIERLDVLKLLGIELRPPIGAGGAAGPDDVVDASIAAWTAHRLALGTAISMDAKSSRIGTIWR